MNTFHCSQYWSYNKGIPSNLHDRHTEFVLHCLEWGRISLGSDLSGIFCQGKGEMYKHFFAVFEKYASWSVNASLSIYINSSFLSECHKVYFGNEHEIQKCSCSDWAKTGYMYKHFLQFLKNMHHGQSMHYYRYTSTVLFWTLAILWSLYWKKNTIPDATPTKKKCQ